MILVEFIGGPWDGQRHEVASTVDRLYVMASPQRPEWRSVWYRRMPGLPVRYTLEKVLR